MIGKIDNYFSEVMNAILHVDRQVVEKIVLAINHYRSLYLKRVLVMGNGGSSTTASHFAGDLSKTCGIESYCLSDSNYLVTAYGNDDNYDSIFLRQIEKFGREIDVLVAISGSGRSPNIIKAVKIAKERYLTTIGLTGFDGGLLKDLCDICLVVPSNHMEVIEDVHLAVCHCIVEQLKGV